MYKSEYKILIVDDEKDVREILQYNIKKEGYTVYTAKNGDEAIEIVKNKKPHIIILDVMMPVTDGYQTCANIRELPDNNDTIIIFLSARNEDYSQIVGFEAGGDDYITKPVSPKVLLSKIKALLKRYKKDEAENNIISFGEYRIDITGYVIYKNNEKISLPKKQFEILKLIASKPNHVFTRDNIFEKIWGNDVIVGTRTIDVHVRKIREKTGIKNIKTIKGIGYKFED
ncbi:MAG: response regulator transcription factor [Bacteroidales bacterium]|nr:response regulator transcription factor [Bacteroidales bacterium]